jgi:hypothetical protein
VQVPFLFKAIVDALNVPITGDTTVWILAGSLVAGCEFFHHLFCFRSFNVLAAFPT